MFGSANMVHGGSNVGAMFGIYSRQLPDGWVESRSATVCVIWGSGGAPWPGPQGWLSLFELDSMG